MLITRIAPSPSGDMHIGTARTAYFNWLAARATGGTFILRIDDTNAEKNDPKHVDTILEIMDWLGLDYDDIYYQSERLDLYKELVTNLITFGGARITNEGTIVLDDPEVPNSDSWNDEIAGEIKINDRDKENIKDLILFRSNGTPTYHFASVCDDIDMGVNAIIRGTDHIPNTARQIAIFDVFYRVHPKFYHVGLVHHDKKKLSKRDPNGMGSIKAYKDAGYDPDAMLNFMLRMGWGPKVDDKSAAIITKDRAIELFLEGGGMRSAPANLDVEKLNSYDRKYKAKKNQ